jgi:O-antigen/teichoic acid export membrane protein
MKKFWLYVAETSAARIYGIIAGTASLVLTARLLGPSGRGVLAAVTAWVALFSGIAGLSLGQVAIYQASNNPDESWFRKTLGSLLAVDLLLSLLSGVVAAVMWVATRGNIFGHLPLVLLSVGFVAVPFQIWEQYSSNLLMAIGQLRIYNKAQVIGRTVALILVYILVGWFRVGVVGAICATVLSQISISVFGFRALWRRAEGRPAVDSARLASLLKGGFKLHLNAIGMVLFTQADVVMLNHYRSKAEVGWYQFALQLITMLLIIPGAASMVLYARMGEQGPDNLWPEQKKIGVYLMLGMLAIVVSTYFIAPWAIPFVAGQSFTPSVHLLQTLLPTVLGLTASTFMANQWIGRGLFLQAATLTLVGGLAILVLNAILIPRYGTMGAIYAALIVNFGFVAVASAGLAFWIDRKRGRANPVVVLESQ